MQTKIMGILNVTPDSFFNQATFSHEAAIKRGIELFEEGADIIDVGGESTRPGATQVEEEEELRRVIPVIEALREKVSIPLSIDTMKPGVADTALKAGATLINDVGGFRDPAMIEIAVKHQVSICVMHMQGIPKTMQQNPIYPEGVVSYLLHWFENQIATLTQKNINPENIILDPGIGFGKTVDDNIEIIQNLHKFKKLGHRVLLGVSRKSFLGKILNKPPKDLLSATLTTNVLAIISGVDIIRVHDVDAHRNVVELLLHMQEK